MSDFNSAKNRVVWVDIAVADLDRAARFYEAVLGVPVPRQEFNGQAFCVIDHQDGNGGCLIVNPDAVAPNKGPLVYLNVAGRIRAAAAAVASHGGEVLQEVHPIGPHGFRAVIADSEGNRLALHSPTDG